MPSDERDKENHNQEYTISSLIKKEFILVEKEVMSKEEILKKGCDLLYKNEYVKQGFYEDVLKREEISASVLGGGVALPHGMANLVIKPAVVIMKCAQKNWNGRMVVWISSFCWHLILKIFSQQEVLQWC